MIYFIVYFIFCSELSGRVFDNAADNQKVFFHVGKTNTELVGGFVRMESRLFQVLVPPR